MMISPRIWTRAVMLVAIPVFVKEAAAACDPTKAACPPNIGLDSASYFIDFTQQSSLPANWTLANYETVTYGSYGAEFTFAKRYDAPYIWTDFYFLFGTVEVVMQAAPGNGIVSSAVLISDDLDEIDWEFSGNNFGTSSGLVQTNYFGKGVTGTYDRGIQVPATSPQTTFHTYKMDWTPDTLTWSIDGNVVRTLSNSHATSGDHQYPQSPMQVHLGLWDAGDASTAAGTRDWAGGLTDLSKVPFTAYVKSVKIENLNPCGSYAYGDMSGSAASIVCGSGEGASGGEGSTSQAPTPVNENQVIAAAGEAANASTTATPSAIGSGSGDDSVTITEDDCSCTDHMGRMTLVPSASWTGLPAIVSYYTAPSVMPTGNYTLSTPSVIVPAITPARFSNAASRGRVVPLQGLVGAVRRMV